MDRMFAPWRLAYIKGQEAERPLPSPTGCIFCDYQHCPSSDDRLAWDQARLVVTVREHALVMLNKFPYGNGHVMVVPRRHGGDFEQLSTLERHALSDLLAETVAALKAVYAPAGLNIGMNIGEAGGAGIAQHLHYHALPRWRGDVNFMPVFAETRVLSEALSDTWFRLAHAGLRQPGEGLPTPHP